MMPTNTDNTTIVKKNFMAPIHLTTTHRAWAKAVPRYHDRQALSILPPKLNIGPGHGMALKRIALILTILWLSPIAHAETAYVGDNLRIGVRPEPGTRTAPIQVISSGDKIETLESRDSYSRIRTENGTVGWVRNVYLSKEPPAKLVVEQLQEKYSQAQQALLDAQDKLAASNNDQMELSQKIQQLKSETYELHQKLAALRPDNRQVWIYMIIALLSLCSLTFTIGLLWEKQRIAKKLGGQSL
jgi:hypothetical protein